MTFAAHTFALPFQSARGGFLAMDDDRNQLVLLPGEIHRHEEFGPHTVNRGAVLIECDWDGGRFESGLFMGGMFRSGDFTGGTFLGGTFLSGHWRDGTWEGGFDREGLYHSRGATPSTR